MITLPNTTYKASDTSLSAILNSTTKVNMLTVLNMLQKYYLVATYCDEEKDRMAHAHAERAARIPLCKPSFLP